MYGISNLWETSKGGVKDLLVALMQRNCMNEKFYLLFQHQNLVK